MINLAFDRSTNRHSDADGRLHVDRSNISKAQVSDYFGAEIPGYQELNLNPDKIYKLLRDPEELEKSALTFNNLPVLSKHVPVTAESPRQDLVIGSIGSDVQFNKPYLTASTCIWDAKEIAAIETDTKREWSCAYRYTPDMTPGEYEGVAYDGVMRDIQGNHLALVETGRAGADVYVADSNPFKGKLEMKMTKVGKALFVALQAASPKFAQDANLQGLVGRATKKQLNKADTVKKLIAMDIDMSPEKLDAIIDAIIDVEDSPMAMEPAVDDEPDMMPPDTSNTISEDDGNEKLSEFLRSKGLNPEDVAAACALIKGGVDGYDEDKVEKEVEKKSEEKMNAAMDSLRAEFRSLEKAKQEVRSVVGDLIGMDSAEQVYRFALDHLKVDHKDVKEVSALRALLNLANTKKTAPRVAADSAGLSERFPDLKRFR